MSAYAEWKYGLITDAEYASACREEEWRDKYFETHPEKLDDYEEEVFDDDCSDE